MSKIIDELVVLFKLDSTQFDKAAKQKTATVQAEAKKINVSEADQERINKSREQRATDRAKQSEREKKNLDRERAKSTNELGDKIKGVAIGIGAAALGFESLKGAVQFLGNMATNTAALGRSSDNLGLSAVNVQSWGNAIKLAGGNAEDALSQFGALSSQITAFKLRGEVGPLLLAAQNAGVYARGADGNFKSPDQLSRETVQGLLKRYSRADAFNAFTGAGGNAGFFNLLADSRADEYLATGKAAAYADPDKVDKGKRVTAFVEGFKEKRDQIIADGAAFTLDHPLQAVENAAQFITPGAALAYLATHAGDLYQSAFGEKGATVGVRNNNPGNIENKDGTFKRFVTMVAGRSALDGDLDAKLGRDHLDTVRKVISKYAPAQKGGKFENDTEGYIRDVSKKLGVDPDAHLDNNFTTRDKLIDAIISHEQGAKGTAQVRRALSTPGAVGGPSTTNGDVNNNVQISKVEIHTQATNGAQVAADFSRSLASRGVSSQANAGMTP